MNRTAYKTLAALLWLAPLVILLRYQQFWDQLPARMATHFNAQGHANGWITRELSLYWSAGLLAFFAAVFFTVPLAIAAKHPLTRFSWTLLAFFHAEIWTFVYLQNSLLEYNLGRARELAIAPVLVVSMLGAVVLVSVFIAEKRGTAFSDAEVLAEEVHSGKRLAPILLVPIFALVPIALMFPNPMGRLAMTLIVLISIVTAVMVWDGFHYYFSRHGVEIRTLGLRLKSIPLLQIKDYEVENWNALRGYGIRSLGNCRAYVYGKTGVRVNLYDGSVFLGHNDPQRIVHDLNVIKRYQHS
jgi:hypothetical protein